MKLVEEKFGTPYLHLPTLPIGAFETRAMSKRFVVISDAQDSLGITKFLVNDVGLFPSKQYIVDNTPEEYQKQIRDYFTQLNYDIKAEVGFISDEHVIQTEIKDTYFSGYPLIIGSSWDKKVA